MRFQKNLRNKRDYPSGYRAFNAGTINSDEPVFKIGDSTNFCSEINDGYGLPDTFAVRAEIHPGARDPGLVEAIFEYGGRQLAPVRVYDGQTALERYGGHAAVRLLFKEVITEDESLAEIASKNLVPGQVIFEKEFITQVNRTILLKQEIKNKKAVFDPPGDISGHDVVQPLWGYGGYCRPGCGLADIEQIFFIPIIDGMKTGLHLTKISAWIARGARPVPRTYQAGAFFMDDVAEEQGLSLVGSIEKGNSRLTFQIGTDESGEFCVEQYRSFAIRQHDPATNFVEINFRRGE
ncbi:MAG: hypothetical protein NTX76_03625 [Alphaproteobacteria bacterium]|nr:hypothetical protein [Alphaproteobacteria bacterium]